MSHALNLRDEAIAGDKAENFENIASAFDQKLNLRSVFTSSQKHTSQQHVVDMIAERDRLIEDLASQLAFERQERSIMQGAYHASVDRLRQTVVSQGNLSAAEAAAESRALALQNELARISRQFDEDREKLVVDFEEATRQLTDSLERNRELEQRLAKADNKYRAGASRHFELKSKYAELKQRYKDLTEKEKQRLEYMSSLPSHDELERIQQENRQLFRENSNLRDSVDALNSDLAKLHSDKLRSDNLISQQSAAIIELKSDIERLEGELKPVLLLSNDRTGLEDKPLECQIVAYRKIVSDLEKEVEKQKQISHLYNSQLQIQKKSGEDMRTDLMAIIAKNDEDIRVLQAELDKKLHENSRLTSDVRKLQSLNQDFLVAIEDLKQKVRNYDALASGDAGVLHEDLVEKMYRCVDKCKRLDYALAQLITAALSHREVISTMAKSVDVTVLLSTTNPVVTFEDDMDTSAKLLALIKHAGVITESLDEIHDHVMRGVATVQAEAFPW